MISVVIPAYNEEENIPAAKEALSRVLEPLTEEYELIFIDDGSRDGTWERIAAEASDPCVRGLRFSRNFGKEAAMRAGLDASTGDAVIVIDCDLQHPPAAIPEMLKKWQDGARVVKGIKLSRGKETLLHKGFAALFNSLMSCSVGFDMSGASDFMLLDRKAVSALQSYNEQGSFFRAMAQYVGFETAEVYYDVAPREHGQGKFTFSKLCGYAIKNIAAFSSLPLYLSLWAGAAASLGAVVLFVLKLLSVPLGSFSGGIIALIFLSGLTLGALGVVGYYLSRIYEEIKARPRYIISCDTKERK